MIPHYEADPALYFYDQITKFESFEGELYYAGIKKTIDVLFTENLKGDDGPVILDFCCGDGTATKLLMDKGHLVISVDGNPRKIERARKINESSLVWRAENIVSIIDKIKKPDIIYASHCFEHFMDPLRVLKDCQSILDINGYMIVILPYPNTESEGHPGSEKLMLHKSINEIGDNLFDHGFHVISIEEVNFREPEIIIHLR